MRILGLTRLSPIRERAFATAGLLFYDDGATWAISEARVTGVKFAGGYSRALEYLLPELGLDLDDFDRIAVSTCCEPEAAALTGHQLEGDERLVPVGHHMSHAAPSVLLHRASTGLLSLWPTVAAMSLTPMDSGSESWWLEKREQCSYFIGDRTSGLELVDRDFERAKEVGLAEMYRAFTYFLGWHSYVFAARTTMALAGMGDRGTFPGSAFEFNAGRLVSPIQNDPFRPVEMIHALGAQLDIDLARHDALEV